MVGSEIHVCNVTRHIITIQGQFRPFQGYTRSLILVPIESACDFLLVMNSNLGPIFHSFGDTVVYWSKNRKKLSLRTHHSHRNCLRWGWPLSNFVMNQIFPETRMIRLFDGEEILAFFILIQYQSVTDGQTDGWTDRRISLLWLYQCLHSLLC